MIIGGIIFVVTILDQLIDKPAVDPFVKMRWLDAKPKKAQQNS